MSDISKDLAALRIPQEERGGGRGKPLVVTLVVLLVLGAGAADAWY